jgi:type IV secretory pathway VirD2 relaxase
MPTIGRRDELIVDRTIRLTRPDREKFDGKVSKSRGAQGGGGGAGAMSKRLGERTKKGPTRSARAGATSMGEFDRRQRAVVKIHYFNHANGGGAGLKAHAKYVARDAATRDDLRGEPSVSEADDVEAKESKQERQDKARAHAAYLNRQGASVFYDDRTDGVDGAARAEDWAKADIRHFRLILSAEEGARLRDLPSYTRQVMARAGAALGTTLSWVAVDHHDTDNPHTHIIIRGRRANGQDLVMPKELIKHGFRSIARDVATEWLGRRTPEDERRALDREVRRHAPTRLDRMIEAQASPEGRVKVAELAAPNNNAALTQALKSRMRELERLGLAERAEHGVFRLAGDFRDRLRAMELHIDIRKRVVHDRTMQQRAQDLSQLRKGPLDR